MVNTSSMHDDAVEHQVDGRWTEFVGKAEETYGDLTGDWSAQFNGNMKQARGWLQQKYGDAQEKLADFFEEDEA